MTMVSITFEFTTKYGVFKDALYLPEDHAFTEEEINSMKQQRLNDWLEFVENPPPLPQITVEIDGITYEKIEVDGQILLKPIQV